MNPDADTSRELLDHVAIDRLWNAYADVINRRAFRELDELFLEACQVVVDTHRGDPTVVQGPAGFAAFVGPAMQRFRFFQFVILSARTWIDGDEARGRLYMCELRDDPETGLRSQAFGVYADRFRRVDGRWWFAARRYQTMARTAVDGDPRLEVFEVPWT
jgi:hypothetical protein